LALGFSTAEQPHAGSWKRKSADITHEKVINNFFSHEFTLENVINNLFNHDFTLEKVINNLFKGEVSRGNLFKVIRSSPPDRCGL